MQILINGILQGLIFGSVGVAFALVYRATKVFCLALGGVYALAPFILLASMQAGAHTDIAAHLVDRVLPEASYRQWVLTFLWHLRFLLAVDSEMGILASAETHSADGYMYSYPPAPMF